MADLTNPVIIWFKGGLFAVLGLLSSGLLLWQLNDIRAAILLLVCIWSFCRAYYFAFYVIEKYVDPSYRFAGLYDFAVYAMFNSRITNQRESIQVVHPQRTTTDEP